jgi:TolB-like protein
MLMALLLLLGGCATYESGKENRLIRASYAMADELMQHAVLPIPRSAPVLVATFVDGDNLESSSTLGRMLSEQVAARLTQTGYRVLEVRLRNQVLIRQTQGELMLSREAKAVSAAHDVQAVVVGTYVAAQDRIFINLRVVRPTDNQVIAAHNAAIVNDAAIGQLLLN